ncbi:MAG: hypothetical protein HC890_04805 [Chloroflexaceae bacterium]|nr:hypothetical protein [Chloroflexaceae bacterium]
MVKFVNLIRNLTGQYSGRSAIAGIFSKWTEGANFLRKGYANAGTVFTHGDRR